MSHNAFIHGKLKLLVHIIVIPNLVTIFKDDNKNYTQVFKVILCRNIILYE